MVREKVFAWFGAKEGEIKGEDKDEYLEGSACPSADEEKEGERERQKRETREGKKRA